MRSVESVDVNFKEELNRLARFGANVTDCYSCFIFLPLRFLALFPSGKPLPRSFNGDLILSGHHSLSTEINKGCIIRGNAGLIGWTAKNAQPIHVSPFERDSRMLEVYTDDQQLKSFMAVPVKIVRKADITLTGVVACDSKKSFAFSKLQGKLLEDLAGQVSAMSRLALMAVRSNGVRNEWEQFINSCSQLEEALGIKSIELLRVSPLNLKDLEMEFGVSETIDLFHQAVSLIEQSLPPPRTLYRMPDGDILIVADSMMSSLYANKIEAICRQLASPGKMLKFQVVKCSIKDLKGRRGSLDDLIRNSAELCSARDFTSNGLADGKRNWA